MRQAPNGKRPRNRPGRSNRPQQSRNQTFDSSGPEGKVRGTANQVYDKYLALARDAQLSGDRVSAENFFQHAEHYFRIMVASGQQLQPRPADGQGDDGDDAVTSEGETMSQPGTPQPMNQPRPQAAQPQAAPVQAAPVQATQPQAAPVQAGPVQAAPVQAPPARPETPAELAQAAAANGEGRPAPRPRGRRPRRGPDAAPAEV